MTSALMNKLRLISILAVAMLWGCKTVYVPVKETEYVAVHDTTVLHRTDTLVQVPEFHLSDYTGLADTLVLKSSVAESMAWVDSSLMVLKGRLIQTGTVPVQVVEKERVVYRDSIITKDVPVPVEVVKTVHPDYEWVLWLWFVASLVGLFILGYCGLRR